MKGIIEREIEKYANLHGEYPKTIEITEREYRILNKEVKKEFESIGKHINDITTFRGCNLIKNVKISNFIVR